MDNSIIIGGFVSVKSVLESKSREVFEIILDTERKNTVFATKFHEPEKRQYAFLESCGLPVSYVQPSEFEALNAGATSGGIAARVGERIFTELDSILGKCGYVAVLDGIEDPFNFGYSLRSLYAAGCDAVILPKRNFFSASETVIRASAGASENILACVCEDLGEACDKLKSRGFTIISTAKSEKAKDIGKIRVFRPVCVVFGGEKRGISAAVLEKSDFTVKIKYPRSVHYSLPACCAISVIAFELAEKLNHNTYRPLR